MMTNVPYSDRSDPAYAIIRREFNEATSVDIIVASGNGYL